MFLDNRIATLVSCKKFNIVAVELSLLTVRVTAPDSTYSSGTISEVAIDVEGIILLLAAREMIAGGMSRAISCPSFVSAMNGKTRRLVTLLTSKSGGNAKTYSGSFGPLGLYCSVAAVDCATVSSGRISSSVRKPPWSAYKRTSLEQPATKSTNQAKTRRPIVKFHPLSVVSRRRELNAGQLAAIAA